MEMIQWGVIVFLLVVLWYQRRAINSLIEATENLYQSVKTIADRQAAPWN